ncbi:MAG: very short patch repair endonuclease [Comamonadaceae bacterium]|nr:MAG: very short patch repair endonuclease [Comamonadaceae bacterium]
MPGSEPEIRPRDSVSGQTYEGRPTQSGKAGTRARWDGVDPAVRRNMQANKGKDTGPELAVRSLLHRKGLRFRVNQPLPFNRRRRADITFTRVGLFIFIDGCFWHGCPDHYVEPKTRAAYWSAKVASNTKRDADTDARLIAAGHSVLRAWEHEPPSETAAAIEAAYRRLR